MPNKPTVQEELLAACKECNKYVAIVLVNDGPPDGAEDGGDDIRDRWVRLRKARRLVQRAIERAEREVADAS
jgi:hypothetical protein